MSKTFGKLTLLLMCILCLSVTSFAQVLPCSVEPKAIRAYSVADSTSICLVWPQNTYRQELRVSRRVYTNRPSAWQNWTEIYSVTNPVLAKDASAYCDTNVTSGIHYEYCISVAITNWVCGSTTNASSRYYQYINTGIGVPLRDQRGKLILLVESNIAASISAELVTLTNDLIGDGYKVFRHDVAASEVTAPGWKNNVANVKALIRSAYNTDTNADWSIFIVGHVPIPYSGLSSPGSHTENFGAHPADWYYADMDESLWTDTTANDTTALYPWNRNIPGDGKFDQSRMPSAPELRIGRIDLVNMPAFGKSEVQLLRQYLDRNHAWRHKQFTARDRGLIITAGTPFESHSVFSSFFGSTTNTDLGLWLRDATNASSSYLFAASKGSGYFDRDNQIGRTADFAATHLYAVFTTMYGSYYGGWDSAMHPDNVLHAPLAARGYTLSTYYHDHVVNVDASAMDEAIGYELYLIGANRWMDFRLRYNQWAQIQPGGSTFVINEWLYNYVTLMGDPTLRLRPVAPPNNVRVAIDSTDNVLSWTSAADTNMQGYHVYRAPTTNLNGFARLTSTPFATTSFRDTNAAAGQYRYMVRTVKLEQSANRSYYNASQGIFATGASRLTANFSPGSGRSLLISGEADRQYTVENATNLSQVPSWYPLTNITLSGPNGTVSLADTNPASFYRLKH